LAIYLAITRIRQVVDDLLASGGYQPDTPVAVFHKVTWPDESYVLGTLADIAEKVRAAGYTKHALILVSPALETSLKSQTRRTSSHLYDKSYSHRFRQAEKMPAGRPQTTQNNPLPVVSGQSSAVVMAVTRRGSQLAAKLAVELPAELSIPAKFHSEIRDWRLIANLQSLISNFYPDSALDEVRRRWGQHRQLVLVMPTGVAVRAIAPLLNHKATDPAVVCLDEAGQSVIPLLGGHQAGANNLARQIAGLTGGYAAITTTSDVQGKPVLDRPPLLGERSCHIDPASALTPAIAALVNDEPLGVYLDPALTGLRPVLLDWLAGADNLTWLDNLDELMVDAYAAGLIFSHRRLSQRHQLLMGKSILYYPPVLVAGLGCRRGVPASELHLALETTLAEAGLASESLAALVTVDLKADESGLNQLAAQLGLPLQIVTGAQLTAWAEKLKTPASSFNPSSSSFFSPSAAQEKLGLPGVAEPCAIFAAGGELLVPKRSFARCTVAIALNEG
jgi:cobalamin biosynthesis protein CbiG